MEGKTVVLSVLIMSIVLARIQVEAKICCPTTTAKEAYVVCRFRGGLRAVCAFRTGCKIIDDGTSCPPGFPNDNLENSGEIVVEYCKLGCASYVCGAITTLQNSDASGIVSDAVAQCTNACSAFCTKGSKTALETA